VRQPIRPPHKLVFAPAFVRSIVLGKIQSMPDYYFPLQLIGLIRVYSCVPGSGFSDNIWRAFFGKILTFEQFANIPDQFFHVL
jgi:hypothetical protein